VLSWAAPADDGGSPIASYFVYRRGPGETTFTLIGLTNGSTRTYNDTDIARRTTYTYAVTAFNTYYESAQSNQVTIRSK
jgi:titin